MQEMQVPSLSQEDPLEQEMEIHSSFLAGIILMDKEAWGLQSLGSHRVRHN